MLFRLENDSPLGFDNPTTPEHYWLCRSCSAAMMLHISKEGKVIPRALPARQLMVAPTGVISSRQSGRKGYCARTTGGISDFVEGDRNGW
jgi:hypothetical protein